MVGEGADAGASLLGDDSAARGGGRLRLGRAGGDARQALGGEKECNAKSFSFSFSFSIT